MSGAEENGLSSGPETQVVAFRVGNEEFGVDVKRVEGVISLVDITRMPRAPEFVEGIMNLRGQIIAVIDLAKRLGLAPPERGPGTRIVVVESGQVKVGLIVDSPEVMMIDADEVEPSPVFASKEVESSFITGVVKVGERLLILLDADRIIGGEEQGEVGAM